MWLSLNDNNQINFVSLYQRQQHIDSHNTTCCNDWHYSSPKEFPYYLITAMQVPLINCQFATMCSTCLFEFTILQVKLYMFTFLSNLKCVPGNNHFWFHFIHDFIGKWAQMNTFSISKRTLLLLWNQRPDLKRTHQRIPRCFTTYM